MVQVTMNIDEFIDNIDDIGNKIAGFENGDVSKAELIKALIGKCKNCSNYNTTGVDVKGQDGVCWGGKFMITIPNEDVIYKECPIIKNIEDEDDF